jgi:crotonobetainyl-CoA:carnitine CoA-transferase CaiB-like acyl-CoA transferase
MTGSMPTLLSGTRVVELASVLAGPAAGQFLAELGADVIKVENPTTGGDVTRTWKLPEEDPGGDRSAYFASVNWGKRSIALDLREEDGRASLHRLVAEADIVLSSYRPGHAAVLGADPETLRGLNPRLIVAQVVGYDEKDPRPGYDAVIQAESGFMSINGHPEGPPTKLPVAFMDLLAAAQLKEAILLALLRRDRTGEGATITVSLMRTAIAALANQAANYLTTGRVPARTGSDHPNIAPYGTAFQTSDGGWIVVAVGSDRQFAALCEVVGLENMSLAPTFATNQKRVRNRPFLHELLKEQIIQWKREDLLAELNARGVPAGVVRNLDEVFAHPAAAALVLRDEETGIAAVRSVAFELDGMIPSQPSPPPRFDADANAVWNDGVSESEVTLVESAGSAA